jgi:hypothetical protein
MTLRRIMNNASDDARVVGEEHQQRRKFECTPAARLLVKNTNNGETLNFGVVNMKTFGERVLF